MVSYDYEMWNAPCERREIIIRAAILYLYPGKLYGHLRGTFVPKEKLLLPLVTKLEVMPT